MRTVSGKRHGMGFRGASARAVGVALMVSVLWFLANPSQVYACKCAEPGSPCEEVEKFAVVFAGRVVSVRHSYDPDASSYSPQDHTTVGFEVSTVWKGAVHEEMYVTTPPTGGSCGVPFLEGEEYIVYGHDRDYAAEGYTVRTCSRTALLSQAQADLDMLGAGEAPLGGIGGPAPGQSEDVAVEETRGETSGSSPEQSQNAGATATATTATRDGTSGSSPEQSQDVGAAAPRDGTHESSPEQSQGAAMGREWLITLVVAATILVAGGGVAYTRVRRW